MSLPEGIERALAWSAESLESARILLDNGKPAFAVTRAYYAMFYAAQALLSDEGLDFSKHSAVISRFGQEFAKTGRLAPELHRHLLDAFDARSDADYRFGEGISEEIAMVQMANATEFVATARDYLERRHSGETV